MSHEKKQYIKSYKHTLVEYSESTEELSRQDIEDSDDDIQNHGNDLKNRQAKAILLDISLIFILAPFIGFLLYVIIKFMNSTQPRMISPPDNYVDVGIFLFIGAVIWLLYVIRGRSFKNLNDTILFTGTAIGCVLFFHKGASVIDHNNATWIFGQIVLAGCSVGKALIAFTEFIGERVDETKKSVEKKTYPHH
ncbi:hypothetical protein KAB52_002287 [Salmonella enterica subsp. salamae serovar 4,12:e,n,x:1,6]|nr:hypothetical protein [Salmonella enterica subsp. salamae serovar 4,12:e,n,x:1,6]